VNPVRDDTATTDSAVSSAPRLASPQPTSTVSDDTATTCPVCRAAFERLGRQRFCSTVCRQSAWRSKRAAPVEPVVAKSDTVYECPLCDTRYLGDQRCDDCNTWCRRLGPGGPCPCCQEPISINDLLGPDQLAQTAFPKPNRWKEVTRRS
jgi:hypothetical protein